MEYSILKVQDVYEWKEALSWFASSDIYFSRDYHLMCEKNGDGMAYAFFARTEDMFFFYPFLKRPIEKVGTINLEYKYYDIETVYGYSGPLCNTDCSNFIEQAWCLFSDWCKSERVVAEFVRCSPVLGNHIHLSNKHMVSLNRQTVVVELEGSKEILWNSYSSLQRRNVRKAQKLGLMCEFTHVDNDIDRFKELYVQTMQNVGADSYYLFSDDYFDTLCRDLKSNLRLCTVSKDQCVVASALILIYADKIHYHLAGSDINYQKMRPNNLLIHTVAEWGLQNGFRTFHLGGGRSASPEDSLFRFKSAMSQSKRPFYVGKYIHDLNTYNELCEYWMMQKGEKERPPYFLLYRAE